MDIFDQLKQIEKQNVGFYKNLPDGEKPSVSFYMLLKWMSYTQDKDQILHVNGLLNTKIFPLSQHKELLFDLCCAASQGKQSYKWLKRNLKKSSEVLKMISDAHNCGFAQAEEILELYSKDELLELCSEMNLDKIAADKIKKEINVL